MQEKISDLNSGVLIEQIGLLRCHLVAGAWIVSSGGEFVVGLRHAMKPEGDGTKKPRNAACAARPMLPAPNPYCLRLRAQPLHMVSANSL